VNVDSCTKFVNMISIYDIIRDKVNQGYSYDQIAAEYDSTNVEN
jgi:hypothetical protein